MMKKSHLFYPLYLSLLVAIALLTRSQNQQAPVESAPSAKKVQSTALEPEVREPAQLQPPQGVSSREFKDDANLEVEKMDKPDKLIIEPIGP